MASNPAPGELEQVRAFINTWDADEENRAVQILERHSGRDVHVH